MNVPGIVEAGWFKSGRHHGGRTMILPPYPNQ